MRPTFSSESDHTLLWRVFCRALMRASRQVFWTLLAVPLLIFACCDQFFDPCLEEHGGQCSRDRECATGDGCWCGLCIPAECKGDIDFSGYLEEYIRRKINRPSGPLRYEHVREIIKVHRQGNNNQERDWWRIQGAQCLEALQVLEVPGNFICDLSPLVGLEHLIRLDLSDNWVYQDVESCDFEAIGEVTSLEEVILSHLLSLEHIEPLATLVHLRRLDISENSVGDISPLAGLIELEFLDLSGNPIHDLTPLVQNPGIGQGDKVILSPGGIKWVCDEQAANLQELRDRGVELVVSCP